MLVVAEVATAGVVILVTVAELWHARRCRRVARLAFGPGERPAPWALAAPFLRVAALAAMCWGLVTLILLSPKVHQAKAIPESELRHLLLVLDVSPSMRLEDAGPARNQSRIKRASDVMESFFKRVAVEQYRLSVVAVYNGAKPVVVDTKDLEVVRNILNDLPMHHAFTAGKTDVFSGLEEAARMARPWKPRSTTLLLVTDGDTVPATGMPKMPASVGHVLIVGIGDPRTGKFIDGKQSRQESSILRQIAARLGGTYHDGNEKHLSTDLLKQITQASQASPFQRLTRREYALIACGTGAVILSFLPLLLHAVGTRWQPGVVHAPSSRRERLSVSPHVAARH